MSIPEVKWTKTHGSMNPESFHIIASDEMKYLLRHALKKINIKDDASTELEMNIDRNLEEEGWSIEAEEERIQINGGSMRALYWALSELSQMLLTSSFQKGKVSSTPAFPNRGLMLDVSRGKMPRVDYVKELIDFISSLSMNTLQLYTEDKHKLSSHPKVGSLYGAFSEKDIKEIDEYAKEHFVELQPNIQSFSHMHGILRLPEYADMSENNVLFSLSAASEKALQFLDDEMREVLPWYSSKTVNLNMDEAYDLGTGKTRKMVEEQGKGVVFFEFLEKVIEIARRNGAEKIQIWGDIVGKYPELAKKLPSYVTVIDWNYNPAEEYPSIRAYKGLVKNFWAAPGVSSWNSLFPRVWNSLKNIRVYSVEAYDSGAKGYLNTDWGDYGHYQMYGLSFFGYMYGAECSWNINRNNDFDTFWSNASKIFFPDKHMQKGFRYLMDSNLADNIKTGFKTMSAYAFFDDMFNGLSMNGNERYPKISEKAYTTLKNLGEKALEEFSKVEIFSPMWPELLGETYLDELMLSAEMTAYTGDKGLLAYEIKKRFAINNLSEHDLLGWIIEIKKLYRRFEEIREKFVELWLKRCRRDGMEATLFIFDKAAVQLSKAAIFLSREREALLEGKALSMSDYKGADGYEVLWTSDFTNMWDRAYPWQ